jgi:hypothetical protein
MRVYLRISLVLLYSQSFGLFLAVVKDDLDTSTHPRSIKCNKPNTSGLDKRVETLFAKNYPGSLILLGSAETYHRMPPEVSKTIYK